MAGAADLILGLDGGGTKTLLAVATRDGSLIMMRRSGTLDPFAELAWPDGLARGLGEAECLFGRLACAVLGLPCFGEVPALTLRQQDVVRALLPTPHDVVNDVQVAFTGALAGQAGVLLLAGTGSMAWAGNGEREVRVGGWGEAFGDEGSAHWIGRAALATASRALDGRGPHRDFAHDLLARLELPAEELMAWCYGRDGSRRAAVAALAATVDAMAEAGDAPAEAILNKAGDHLARHAEASRSELGLSATSPWTHAGSVFRSRTVMTRVAERLGGPPLAPRLPPIGGALLRAAHWSGWTTDAAWITRLHQALATPPSGLGTDNDGEPS